MVSHVPTAASVDTAFGRLVEDLTARLQAGERIDWSATAREHPEFAEELAALRPTLELLGQLSRADNAAASGLVAMSNRDDLVPGVLGDYRIIQEIGRGGMGIVYEAEQVSLCRRVALKVLPFAGTMDPRQLQRFRHEAQAAAMLHHPNIVPVHGVGCERSVHFYAMQLIEGQSLAAVIAGMRGETGDRDGSSVAGLCEAGPGSQTPATADRGRNTPTAPIAALSTQRTRKDKGHYRRLAELVAQAADALEYAHQQGVIHRDIKPANLLLDDAGHLWVTDFGLARLGDGTGLTASGDLLGTLRYMSPEQALAKHGMVDHRTDVYSLGATLYELLTLRPAVPGADKQTALRQIAFEEPAPPRKLDATIPPELETIALKALAKEPAERYSSAGEFAADLRRWLSHQTIRARRPSLRQRADKWMRRHSAAVLAAVVALLVGTAVSAWQAVRATNALHRAEGAERSAAVEAAIAKAVNDFLQVDLLGQAETGTPLGRGFEGNPFLTVKEALDRASDRIGHRFQDQPLVEAAIRMTIGGAYVNLDEHQRALTHVERAAALRCAHLEPNHSDVLNSMDGLAGVYLSVGRFSEAITIRQQLLEHMRALRGPDHHDSLGCLWELGSSYCVASQWNVGVPLLEQVLEKHRSLLGPYHPDTLGAMNGLGLTYLDCGRVPESVDLFQFVLDHLPPATPPNTRIFNTMCLGNACYKVGRFDQSERLHREAIDAIAKQPDSFWRRLKTANASGWLARTLLAQERPAEAEPLVREAVDFFEKHRPDDCGRFYWVNLLGGVFASQHRYNEAERLLLQGYQGMKDCEGITISGTKRRLAQAGERVVRFYEATGQTEKASEWRAKLAVARQAVRDP